jgi:hypothetical protein
LHSMNAVFLIFGQILLLIFLDYERKSLQTHALQPQRLVAYRKVSLHACSPTR